MSLRSFAERYRANLFESVIPFWTRHSADREHGGYFTCLDREGRVYDPRKYVWLQGRQIWMYSRLYNEVERRQEWLEMATLGMDFLLAHARDGEGRYYFRLERDGRPSFFQRKPYGAVFAVLALAEYAKTGAGRRYREEAEALFWRIEEWIRDPGLLGRAPLAGGLAFRSLADSIVLVNMALELDEAGGDPRYREVLRGCLRAALEHEDAERAILLEAAPLTAGADLRKYPDGRLFNPGHSVEACWMLWQAAERLGAREEQARLLRILEGSLELGWDREFGGLYYFMDVEGRPLLQLEASMKLWWPHAEALYAVTLAYRRTGDRRWLDWLERLDEYTFGHFVDDPRYGEWFGYCDRRGQVTHTLKGNHYKGCFHVPRALLLCIGEIEGAAGPGG